MERNMEPLILQDPFFIKGKQVAQVLWMDGSNKQGGQPAPKTQHLGQNFEYKFHSRLRAGVYGFFHLLTQLAQIWKDGWHMAWCWSWVVLRRNLPSPMFCS